jgi:hypothetical protein
MVLLEGLGNMKKKKINDLIGNRTRNLPASNIALQPSKLPLHYLSSWLLFQTRLFGDWILSSSSGGTYSDGSNSLNCRVFQIKDRMPDL